MRELHPMLEKVLGWMGVSPTQARWRWHRTQQDWRDRWSALQQTRARHKFCRHCGHLALGSDRTCPQCGKSLPSYLGSKIWRAFALSPATGRVSLSFITVLVLIFCVHLAMTEFRGLLAPDALALKVFGAFSTALALGGEVWRVLTMGLMHIGIIHLVFNLMALSQTLGAIEDEIGPWPTVVLLTVTQLGAVAAHVLWYPPQVLTAGASGIAFGLIGFGVAHAHRSGRPAQRRFYLQWAGYGLLFGLFMGANNAAHIGGLLLGLPLGWLAARMRLRHAKVWRAVGIACLAMWLVALGCLIHEVARHRDALDARRPRTIASWR